MDRLTERVKEAIAIEELITESHPLRGNGRYLKGVEHDSLVVDRHNQAYYWNAHIRDGWDDHGDVIDWAGNRRFGQAWSPRDREMFGQVLEELARRAGIELRPLTPEEENARRGQREIDILLEMATTFYEAQLKEDETARAYLRRRGLCEETVQAFRLGATPGGAALRDHLGQQGLSLKAARRAGLLKGDGDFFDDRRIIIPYLRRGRPAYLSSRLIAGEGEAPKYRHLPLNGLGLKQRPIYNADALFGGDPLHVTEGVFCALSLLQAGYPAIALSGLHLPDSLLPRLQGRPVVLCADADQAGLAAARKQALRIGYQARIARPPRGEDWNALLAEKGGTLDELQAALEDAPGLVDLLIEDARAARGGPQEDAVLQELFTLVGGLPPFPKSRAYHQIKGQLGMGAREARALEAAARREDGNGRREEQTPFIIEGRYPILHPALDFTGGYAITTVGLMSKVEGRPERRPWLVTSGNGERKLLPPPANHSLELGDQVIFLREVPQPMGVATWEYHHLREYLEGYAPDPQSVFQRVRGVFDHYVEFQDAQVSTVLALYTMGTYLHPLFAAFPYIALTGPKASGKTKTMQLICFMAFNGMPSPDFSDAAIFRTVQAYHATLGIDEGERLANPNDPISMTTRLLLKAGYKAGFPVVRIEKTADGLFVPRSFDLYSPKIIANIRGLEDVLESRCIVIRMLRAITAKGSLAVTPETEDWAHIRHELYSLALSAFPQVRAIYRQDARCRPFNNRFNELWSPLLTMALFLDPSGQHIYEPVLACAQESVDTESGQELSEWEELLIIALNALTAEAEESEATAGDIVQQMAEFSDPKDEPPSRQWVGYAIKRFGFTDRRQTRKGRAYRIQAQKVEELIRRYGVRLPSVKN